MLQLGTTPMTTTSTAFLLLAAGCMAIDWWSVASRHERVELAAKPAVMIGLLGVAITADLDATAQPWIVAALLLGLVGDIVLLPQVDRFVVGLAAFLVGHLAYSIAFATLWSPSAWLVVGAVGVVVLIAVAGRPIETTLRGSPLHLPVLAYVAVTAVVVLTGSSTGRPLIVSGVLAFAASDGLLGAGRFLDPSRDMRVGVHVLYQLGQAAIVLGAVTS